jgi:beta-glucosidase
MREIYLKGFEICVKNAKPVAVMTSVNLVNGVHAANDRDLLTSVLRDEWGFDGIVMTDWFTTVSLGGDPSRYPCSTAEGCISAGNDLIMPGSQADIDAIVKAVKEGEIRIDDLQKCAVNILNMLIRLRGGEK